MTNDINHMMRSSHTTNPNTTAGDGGGGELANDDGKVEEEAMRSSRKGTESAIHIAVDDENGRSRNNTGRDTIMEDEEEEEHKYEVKDDAVSSDREFNDKSKSRRDENVDQEHLYTAYDDEEDDDDGHNGRLSLNMATPYQYSRSVTPDYTHSGTQPMAQTPPQPLLGGMKNVTVDTLDLKSTLSASPKGKRKKRTDSGAPMSTVPSESPESPYRSIVDE